MKIIYKGPTGSGKTTKLMNKYMEIGRREGTDQILTFVKNAAGVSAWRENIDLETVGLMNIHTYFGFVRKEISDYWPQVELKLPGGFTKVEPTFMNVETAHYLMSKYVLKSRKHSNAFDYINATTEQIAVQLIDNLNQAAMNCLSIDELQDRLLKWASDDTEKIMVFNEAAAVMRLFRDFCINNRILDYSLLIDLYNKHLMDSEDYLKELKYRYHYLFVDNLEKSVPSAQKLLFHLLKNACDNNSYLAFNPEEKINIFFGGNPELAEGKFFPLCDVKELKRSHTSTAEARSLAESLYKLVFEDGTGQVESDFIKKEINTELRGDMLHAAAEEVISLIESGTVPDQIALIAPIVDKVMEFSLERYFTQRGYSFINLTRSKRLVDIPFSQALITLTQLANPEWNTQITYSALQQTLSLILKLDPVRSAVLSDAVFKNNMELLKLDEINLRSRIGFDNAEKYDYLQNWIKEQKNLNLELDHFFQRVFAELLAPLEPSEEDILACRQMIDSVSKFKNVVSNFKEISEEDLSRHFIDMIYSGTLAAEVLYNYPEDEKKIVLSTPYKFLYSPDIKKVKFLFWLDISSENWLRSTAKELFNPYILTPQWEKNGQWDDNIDQKLRREQLTAYLQSILSKANSGLYIADSYLNSRGWEQEGQLYTWLKSLN